MSDEPTSFRIPEGVVATVTLIECSNCHSPTPEGDLAAGLCGDCQAAVARAARKPEQQFVETIVLPVDEVPADELGLRRELRRQVKQAADPAPQGWIQHAMEAVRAECVRSRTGHEFTIDTIIEDLERRRVPMPPAVDSMRFVMQEAVARGWCAQTERTQPSRRDNMQGRQVRVYRSAL